MKFTLDIQRLDNISYQIIDSQGDFIFSGVTSDKRIDISNLDDGVYFCILYIGEHTKAIKLSKVH